MRMITKHAEEITMDQDRAFGLPRDLGDGLLLRWATAADAEQVAQFNLHMHSDDPDNLEQFLYYWTHDLMNGRHPTTGPDDFTVVVDTQNDDKIVSTLCLISQRWAYDGIEFGVGRPELVATDPDYRRRGLIRLQMDAVHAKSAARGEMVQAITGIPWYYRMFGYEMGLDLGGGRRRVLPPKRAQQKKDEKPSAYELRAATLDDLSVLSDLYRRHCAESRIMRLRDDAQWRYEMVKAHPETFVRMQPHLIIHRDSGEVAGYVDYRTFATWTTLHITEVAAAPGHSWRAIGLFLLDELTEKALALNEEREKPFTHVTFGLGAAHPMYRALLRELDISYEPYAWYVRVPDLPGFLRLIAPALERRLADSVMAGHSGVSKLNFYTSHLALAFAKGRLTAVDTYQPKALADGDGRFPDLTFLQLLFGYRSVAELTRARADCWVNDEAAVLLDILFPRQSSVISGLG